MQKSIQHSKRAERSGLRGFGVIMIFRELSPAFPQKNVPIVFMSSNEYVPYLYVCIQSILKHTAIEWNYDIIILHKSISEENQEQLIGLAATETNISVRLYNPESILNGATLHVSSHNYAREAYYRMLSPWILSQYEKAIVMDCDIIANRDLSELFQIDTDQALVGGCIDIVFRGMLSGMDSSSLEYCQSHLKMENPYDYINTGVLIFNLALCREQLSLENVISFASSNQFRIQEQDALNALFYGKIKFLDIGWNFYVGLNDWVNDCIALTSGEDQVRYKQAQQHPNLIHYANIPKPWNNPNVPFGMYFWNTARQTSYYEILLSRLVDNKIQHYFRQRPTCFRDQIKQLFKRIINILLPAQSKRRIYIKNAIRTITPLQKAKDRIYSEQD